jgi:radical SAM protein with 4Fe4S-binding SPASM domain
VSADRPRLRQVLFEVTERCNLDCRYCYNVWKAPLYAARPRGGSYAAGKRVLGRLLGQARVGRVTLTGGEPLLVRRLPELALFCRLRGARVSVLSNGTAGTAEDLRQLVQAGVDLFQLPVLADEPAVHDGLTGVPGSWWRTLRTLRDVQELGAEAVAVVVLTRANAERLPETLCLLHHLDVRRVMLNRFNLGGRGLREARRLALAPGALRAAYRAADRLAGELALEITGNVCTPECLLDPASLARVRFGSCSPDPARRPLTLGVAGELRYCNHSPVVLGNLFESTVGEILASTAYRRWERELPAACAGCEALRRCRGGCRAAAEQVGGGLSAPDPILAGWSGSRG